MSPIIPSRTRMFSKDQRSTKKRKLRRDPLGPKISVSLEKTSPVLSPENPDTVGVKNYRIMSDTMRAGLLKKVKSAQDLLSLNEDFKIIIGEICDELTKTNVSNDEKIRIETIRDCLK